jgi:hypothetical protein
MPPNSPVGGGGGGGLEPSPLSTTERELRVCSFFLHFPSKLAGLGLSGSGDMSKKNTTL